MGVCASAATFRNSHVIIYHYFYYCLCVHVHLTQLGSVEPLKVCAASGVCTIGQGQVKSLEPSQTIFKCFLLILWFHGSLHPSVCVFGLDFAIVNVWATIVNLPCFLFVHASD